MDLDMTVLPEVREFSLDPGDVITTETANALAIVDADSYSQGFELLDAFNELEARIIAYHKPVKSMANKLVKEVREREAQDLRPVQEAKRGLSQRLAAWKTAQDAADRARQREAQRLADEAARAAQLAKAEAIKRLAAAEPNREIQAALRSEASTIAAVNVTASAVPVESSVPHIPGGFVRKTWRAEVFDVRALMRAWLDGRCVLDEDALIDDGVQTQMNAQARSHGAMLEQVYPGVRGVFDSGVIKRRK